MNILGRGTRALLEGAQGKAAADVSWGDSWALLGYSGSLGMGPPDSTRGGEASSCVAGYQTLAAGQMNSSSARGIHAREAPRSCTLRS